MLRHDYDVAVQGARLPGHVGRPLPGVEVALVHGEECVLSGTEHGTRVHMQGVPHEGDLLVRGTSLFRGYWRNPEATAREFTADGWVRYCTSAFPRDAG